MKRGRLVAFEGVDGSGKSTQVARVVAALVGEGHDVVATREPTEGEYGRRIRAMARSGELVDPAEELRWFLQDRSEHVAEVLAPALASGKLVVTDRYFLSTVAYQGARGLDWQEILTDSEARFPLPDRVLLFDLPADEGLARVTSRGAAPEPAFERVDYLTRVAAIFAAIERPYVVRVDARGTEDEVTARALAGLRSVLSA